MYFLLCLFSYFLIFNHVFMKKLLGLCFALTMALVSLGNPKVDAVRECTKQFYNSQLSVRELTNKNDNPIISAYFRKINLDLDKALPSQRFWCGAFCANAWKDCGVKCPVRGWSLLASVDTWRNLKAYHVNKQDANTGDTVAYTFRHVESIYEVHPNPSFPFFTACGGNTDAPLGAKGDLRQGVWKKPRLWREVAQITSLSKVVGA